MRRASRPADHRIIAGVSAGLADHLVVSVWTIRIAFVVATWFNGVGLVAYLLCWWFVPLRTPEDSPGVESASRFGTRQPRSVGSLEIAQAVALVLAGAGVLWLLIGYDVGGTRSVVPLGLAAIGIAVVWRQLDDRAWSSWLRQTSGWGFVLRAAVGVGFVGLAAVVLLNQGWGLGSLVDLVVVLAVALLGVLLLFGPWVYSLVGDLDRERRERIRNQERADVAAHLHDSVLQTLALLQTQANDPAAVTMLARRQERELRSWLFGDDVATAGTLATALRSEAHAVEEDHRVAIDVVTVGDRPLDDDLAALVRASREAMVNAAKHAGVSHFDVYLEVAADRADVFVRDRGPGFDVDTVPADRLGVRSSILERLARHHGEAEFRTDRGTEVRLTVRFDPVEESS